MEGVVQFAGSPNEHTVLLLSKVFINRLPLILLLCTVQLCSSFIILQRWDILIHTGNCYTHINDQVKKRMKISIYKPHTV